MFLLIGVVFVGARLAESGLYDVEELRALIRGEVTDRLEVSECLSRVKIVAQSFDSEETGLSSYVQYVLQESLFQSGVRVLGESGDETVISEFKRYQAGLTDAATSPRLGKQLSPEHLLFVRAGVYGRVGALNVDCVDLETSDIIQTFTFTFKATENLRALNTSAGVLSALSSENLAVETSLWSRFLEFFTVNWHWLWITLIVPIFLRVYSSYRRRFGKN